MQAYQPDDNYEKSNSKWILNSKTHKSTLTPPTAKLKEVSLLPFDTWQFYFAIIRYLFADLKIQLFIICVHLWFVKKIRSIGTIIIPLSWHAIPKMTKSTLSSSVEKSNCSSHTETTTMVRRKNQNYLNPLLCICIQFIIF